MRIACDPRSSEQSLESGLQFAVEAIRILQHDAVRPWLFVGLANYAFIITDADMLIVLRNTLLWVVLVPLFSVVLGLLIVVLIDRIGRVVERIIKALIFLPMAISFVGASVIWRFVYFQPAGYPRVGLLNAVVTALGGSRRRG